MALKNESTGEYFKIINIRLNPMDVDYLIFKDYDQRQRFESGLSPYEHYKSGSYNGGLLATQLELKGDATKSVRENVITAAYNALKLDMFSEWIDA